MIDVNKILLFLNEIQKTNDEDNITQKIREINKILLESDEETGNDELDSFLIKMGMDLELYVPDSNIRTESRLFYNTETLHEKVRQAIVNIKKINK